MVNSTLRVCEEFYDKVLKACRDFKQCPSDARDGKAYNNNTTTQQHNNTIPTNKNDRKISIKHTTKHNLFVCLFVC